MRVLFATEGFESNNLTRQAVSMSNCGIEECKVLTLLHTTHFDK